MNSFALIRAIRERIERQRKIFIYERERERLSKRQKDRDTMRAKRPPAVRVNSLPIIRA